MSQRKGGMQEIGATLSKLRLPHDVKAHLQNSDVWTKWSDIVGGELFRVTAPLELRGKTLIIEVAHQAWAQQLHFLKPSILGKLRQYVKGTKIENLEFRIAKNGRRFERKAPSVPKESSPPKSTCNLEAQLSERQKMTLRAVEDPELRESIRLAMEAENRRLS